MFGVPLASSLRGLEPPPLCVDPFRWTGRPMEREDDLISEAFDVISVADEAEPEDVKPVIILVDDSDGEEDDEGTVIPGNTTVVEEAASTSSKRFRNQSPSPVARDELAAMNCYRQHFAGRHHQNFIGKVQVGETVVLSFTKEDSHYRIIVWRQAGTFASLIPASRSGANPTLTALAQQACEQVNVGRWTPVTCPEDSHLISRFEEETEIEEFKFFILTKHSGVTPLVDKFITVLGQRVQKQHHLDVYTMFKDRDVMLRVATMSDREPMQASVVVVFQEEESTLPPANDNMHTTILVRPLDSSVYEVTVATRDEPLVLRPVKFRNSDSMKEFVLTKLVKAEIASTASQKRTSLFRKLIAELEQQSRDFLGAGHEPRLNSPEHPKTQVFAAGQRDLQVRISYHEPNANAAVIKTPRGRANTPPLAVSSPHQLQVQAKMPPMSVPSPNMRRISSTLHNLPKCQILLEMVEVEPITATSLSPREKECEAEREETSGREEADKREIFAVKDLSEAGTHGVIQRQQEPVQLNQDEQLVRWQRRLADPLESMVNIESRQKDVLWAGRTSIQRVFPSYPLDCAALEMIIEIVGYFIDHVAKLSRKVHKAHHGTVSKTIVEKIIKGNKLYSFYGKQEGGRRFVNLTVVRKRFLQFFPQGTRSTAATNDLLTSLASDFVVHLSAAIRKVCPNSDKLVDKHIEKALDKIRFDFLLKPDERK